MMVLACAVCNLPSQLLEGQDVPQPPLNAHQNLKSASCKIHSKTRSLALGPLFDHMECKKHRAGVVTLNLGQSLLSNVNLIYLDCCSLKSSYETSYR